MYSIGQIVYSKCGRDKLRPFIVTEISQDFVCICDGDLRRLEKPKKKNKKHIQITHKIDYNIKQKLEEGKYLTDADFRKALAEFEANRQNG